ncbi:MAG: protein translocase subunit SecF [Eubacteriales bacterium]|nr:protein translocase subunit SecF [Eubacteriales bacterium]MDD3866200.1 protein translocase subunit SecF [Eubacteriales bacterium]MDD4462234.1 protein translocase subunit SecF [Eubacteriales bacterium]
MFSFYKHRKVFFAISLALIIAGALAAIFFGIDLDIQFKGGSLLTYSYTGEIDLKTAESVVSDAIDLSVTGQSSRQLGDETTNLVISVSGNQALLPEDLAAIESALNQAFPENGIDLENATLVDPFIGREALINMAWAVLLAMVLIIGFVWFSFRSMSGPSAGIMALVALFHDLAIVFSVFILLRQPLNESLIAVVLTILGYSVYDTIVIYDRIRENRRLYRGKMSLQDLVDLSIRQSLRRSILTSVTTSVAIGVVYVFAILYDISSIRQFALPMMIGLISGAYSSICLAGPLWVMWKTRRGQTGY